MATLHWWQTAVFYQIYPRSFADGNTDGIGDLKGILAHLDYVKDLGVDAIWLSPHYPSPQFDCGYDIADYTAIDPEYGTLEDFKRFLDESHKRGLKVILDLVLNHTSDQHPWFLESRSSKDNPKRDWYIWKDGRNGGPPNNWSAAFDDCAWTFDPHTKQWYYHFFFAQQPDLNWRNPEVVQAMWKAVRFWLDMGVDGYRLDAIGTIFENPDLPDHRAEISRIQLFQRGMESFPAMPDAATQAYLYEQYKLLDQYQTDQPGVHELLQELRAIIDEYDERVLIGETDEVSYYGDGDNELHMVFNFPLMRAERITPELIRMNQEQRLGALPPAAWPCNTLGNHDSPRVHSRYGDGMHDDQLARLSLALMLTLKGTPFLYNGEEIGMRDFILPSIDLFRDNMGVWIYKESTENFGVPVEAALTVVQFLTRDKCRTPMQWANASNGGFSPAGVRTWLPVNPNYAQGVNVEDQQGDPDSMLSFYKRMLAMRKNTPALIGGEYQHLSVDSEKVFAFLRSAHDQRCLVALNFSDQPQKAPFALGANTAKLVFSSVARKARLDLVNLTLAPFEILIAEI